MDSSALSWLSEMGLESSIFMDDCDYFKDLFDEDEVAILQQGLEACLSAETEQPENIKKLKHHRTCSPRNESVKKTDRASSNPVILSFGNENVDQSTEMGKTRTLSPEEEAAVSEALRSNSTGDDQSKPATPAKKNSRVRPPSQTYDHIIAERKRREQLSQRFVALSTIVPGIKKMDKTSVLGDAINYLKHLQERVKTLEEKAKKHKIQSAVVVRKSHINEDSDKMNEDAEEQPLPEVEAKISHHSMVLRIQCEIQKGILVKLLSQVEDLNLAVVSTNVTSMGGLALDIRIIAEMDKEFTATVEEVVKKLRAATQVHPRLVNETLI